jgi:hypothetical protein
VNSEESAEVIRRRMAELRRELTCDVRDVSRSTREMAERAQEIANPLFYVRRYPLLTAAAAAAIGYLLIPKKKQVITPSPEMLAELVRNHQVKLDTSKVSSESQGMLKSLVVMGLTWGLRTGLNYAGQQLAAAMTKPATAEETSQPAPAPSPLEEPWNTAR